MGQNLPYSSPTPLSISEVSAENPEAALPAQQRFFTSHCQER
jgi:hypothetical protein